MEPAPAVPDQLQFTSTTLDGTPFDGADLAGRPAVFWFWAPWCPNCRAEAPQVAAAADSLGIVAEAVSSVDQAVERALGLASPDDLILITGSLYVVGPARTLIRSEVDA